MQTADCGVLDASRGMGSTDCGFRNGDFGMPVAKGGLWIRSCELYYERFGSQILNLRFQILDLKS